MSINLLADVSLPCLSEAFGPPFVITRYQNNSEIPGLLPGKEILLCRSTLPVNQGLIGDYPLKIVATASSGSDHIDSTYLAECGITLQDAKGCNAVSVADYVVSCIAYLKTSLAFNGRKAGVIGAGVVGTEVAARLTAIGFEVIRYDPPKALRDPCFKSAALSDLFECELLCIHANRHNTLPYPSMNLLDEAFFKQLRPGCTIINAARGGIVNEEALLKKSNSLIYCTDVYTNEPRIDARVVEMATLCTPHIAGHSIEAKKRAITLLSEKLHAYYQLSPPPPPEEIKKPELTLTPSDSWEAIILSLYNPYPETQQLKKTKREDNWVATFENIRKAHNTRHEFSRYNALKANAKLNLILGAIHT